MNHSWRETILTQFVPQLSPLTLVADPDGLLADALIQESLQERGFALVEYQDAVTFRYFFETVVRPGWLTGEQREWVIVVTGASEDFSQLPYDLLQKGRQLSFSFSQLFPHFTYHELSALGQEDLDILYRMQATLRPNNLGENGSRDFILRHVFGLDATMVKDEVDLLALLLRLHLGKRPLPAPFANRLQQQLQQDSRLSDWPLAILLTDSSALFAFLQERWLPYLDSEASPDEKPLRDTAVVHSYSFQWPGPALLPFGRADIRAFVDTLFLEGRLHPVPHPFANKLKQLWVKVGVQDDPARDREQRLTRLLDKLAVRLPAANASHQEWITFAPAWAEAVALHCLPIAPLSQALHQQFSHFQTKMDVVFGGWLRQRYKYLATLSPHPPVMVHHIPRSLSRQVTRYGHEKTALLVMDGLAFDQWLIVRDILMEQLLGVRFQESGVFAWIPTLTAVSRQSLFAGEIPLYFPDSINTTAKDAKLWSLFWENKGLSPAEIGYERKLRAKEDFTRIEQLLSRPNMRVVGLVVDQVDHMMHGMTLGLTGLHEQIRLWMQARFLAGLIERLAQAGYEIYLSSDHGNVAATGIGRPSEGALANLRGQRVRVYPNDTLRQQVQRDFTAAVSWSVEGLPDGFYPLLAPDRHAFIQAGEGTVTHGGHLLEEVVVPYIKIMLNTAT